MDARAHATCRANGRYVIQRHQPGTVQKELVARIGRRVFGKQAVFQQAIERIMDVNFFGSARLINAVLPEMIARRRAIRDRYAAGLATISGLTFLGRDAAGGDAEDNCWLTCVVLPEGAPSPDAVMASLETVQIEARHLWKPMHLQPVFSSARSFTTGAAEELFDRGVTLPSGSELTDDQIDRVIEAVHVALQGRADVPG